jgi:mycothiol synthase
VASSPPPVTVRDADPQEALAFLAALESASGVPPVDEDEQRRLAGHPPVRDPGWDWAGHLVDLDGAPVAYAGIRMPPSTAPTVLSDTAVACAARVDLAVDREHPESRPALAAALEHLRVHVGTDAESRRLEAWLRGATDDDLAAAGSVGFRERRRLHVLGRDTLDDVTDAAPALPATTADGVRLRTFDPDAPADTDAVVRLLTRAYPELGGWYAHGFAVLRAAPWFRADDLLLAETASSSGDDARGHLLALHWMKRRGETVGEVYNLAVDPDAQGRGLGPLLLDVGLAHLAAAGCREVVLWADATNTRALALYRSRGFTHRWDDVSLTG